jgi:hypothetical protein
MPRLSGSLAGFSKYSLDEGGLEPEVMMLNQLPDQGLDGSDVSGRFSAK